MTFNALRMCLRRRFKEAGVPFKGIRGFRRSFAIAFLDAGGYAENLQQIAGWNRSRWSSATRRPRPVLAPVVRTRSSRQRIAWENVPQDSSGLTRSVRPLAPQRPDYSTSL
jgi:hypothetical protein